MKLGESGSQAVAQKAIDITADNFDEYYTKSRYIPFTTAINTIQNSNENILSSFDLGSADGHFVYLANKYMLDCMGCDLHILNNTNDIFIKHFKKECIFKFDINYLQDLENNYDIITNFHLTHIFDEKAFKYLLEILSNKCKFAYLHISKNNIENIKNYNFIEIIKYDIHNININGIIDETFIFIKFLKKITINKYFTFIRPVYNITLNN